MNQEQKNWEKLKNYLLAVHEEYSERNGLDYCKNCGVSMKDLVDDIENIVSQAEQRGYNKAIEEIDKEKIKNAIEKTIWSILN